MSKPQVRPIAPPCPFTDAKYIALTRGEFAIVDDVDFERLNEHFWRVLSATRKIYAARWQAKTGCSVAILMHREVLSFKGVEVPKGCFADHINGDGLDNRRNNLRVVNRTQNRVNSGLSKNNTSGYKGVYKSKGQSKWQARIKVQKETHNLGSFLTAEEAAIAYNEAAYRFFGEFASLNRIEQSNLNSQN